MTTPDDNHGRKPRMTSMEDWFVNLGLSSGVVIWGCHLRLHAPYFIYLLKTSFNNASDPVVKVSFEDLVPEGTTLIRTLTTSTHRLTSIRKKNINKIILNVSNMSEHLGTEPKSGNQINEVLICISFTTAFLTFFKTEGITDIL
jgi:hypothetical protein